ncbi:MAG: hypothetical protein JWO67_3843 [Streptosporangiaceae bacterium]|nr:hypothetical protein [Streptosporangiaceae bacterium]
MISKAIVRPLPTFHQFTEADDCTEWADWFYRHGVTDVSSVWLSGWAVRNTEARQIVFLELVKDGPGRLIATEGTVSGTFIRFPMVVARVVQLESPPLPFPP